MTETHDGERAGAGALIPGALREQLRADILATYGIGQQPPSLRARLTNWWEWPIVQWWWYRQYKRADRRAFAMECAQIRARALEAEFRAALPRRMNDVADELDERLADVLRDGMRFEWTKAADERQESD